MKKITSRFKNVDQIVITKEDDREALNTNLRYVINKFTTTEIKELIQMELVAEMTIEHTYVYYNEYLPLALEKLIKKFNTDEDFIAEEMDEIEKYLPKKVLEAKVKFNTAVGGTSPREIFKEMLAKSKERKQEQTKAQEQTQEQTHEQESKQEDGESPTVKQEPKKEKSLAEKLGRRKPTTVKQESKVVKKEVMVETNSETPKEIVENKVVVKDVKNVKEKHNVITISDIKEKQEKHKNDKVVKETDTKDLKNTNNNQKVGNDKYQKIDKVELESDTKVIESNSSRIKVDDTLSPVKDKVFDMKYEQKVNNIDNVDLKQLVDKITSYEKKKYSKGIRPELDSYINIPVNIINDARKILMDNNNNIEPQPKEVFMIITYFIFAKIQEEITGNVVNNKIITIKTIDNIVNFNSRNSPVFKKVFGKQRTPSTSKLFSNVSGIITSTKTKNIDNMKYETVKNVRNIKEVKERFKGIRAPRSTLIGVGRGYKVKHEGKLVYTRKDTIPLSIEELIICCECSNPYEAIGILVQLKISTLNGVTPREITLSYLKTTIAEDISHYTVRKITNELTDKQLISKKTKYNLTDNKSTIIYSVTSITKRVILQPSEKAKQRVEELYGQKFYDKIHTVSYEIKISENGKVIFDNEFTRRVALEEIKIRYKKFRSIAHRRKYNMKYYKEVTKLYKELLGTAKENKQTTTMNVKKFNNLLNMMKLVS